SRQARAFQARSEHALELDVAMNGRRQLEGERRLCLAAPKPADALVVAQAQLEKSGRLPSPLQARAHSAGHAAQDEQKRLETHERLVPLQRELELARKGAWGERRVVLPACQSQKLGRAGSQPSGQGARR